jgi:hypothetical protein
VIMGRGQPPARNAGTARQIQRPLRNNNVKSRDKGASDADKCGPGGGGGSPVSDRRGRQDKRGTGELK